MSGTKRDKERDSHHPADIISRPAIPKSYGLEQASAAMETDKTKWLICALIGGNLLYTQADVPAIILATGTIFVRLLTKVRFAARLAELRCLVR